MNKRISFLSALAIMAAIAVPALTSADEAPRDVVHDARGNVILDARGNCVRTQWESDTDECNAPVAQAHTKLASVYFDFNKSTLTAKARATLNALLATLHDKKIEAVTIAGYADSIGSDSYNLRLSEKRANAVKHYLDAHGFTHSNVDMRALGKRDAREKTACSGLKGAKLHACMQEDRRVDIELSVVRK